MDRSAEDTNGGRSLKRQRVEDTNENDTQSSTSLPPEVLGNIMNFLDYKTVLSCAATSKSFLHAMQLVRVLHIDKSSQLNALYSRYRDVRVINISSLLCREGDIMMVDNETVLKVIPFLSHFPKLEKVFLGGKDEHGKKFGVGDVMDTRYSFHTTGVQCISNLILQISYAYQSNFLPKSLLVLGIRCPTCCIANSNREGDSTCPCCQLACKTWPLEHVINFNNKGSSRWRKEMFEQRRPNTLDVCLTRDQLETIVKGRSGGEEMICPERRLLHLLGNGVLHTIRSDDDGSSFYIVQFSQIGVDRLKEEVTKLNGKQLSKEDVTKAIMNSFSIYGAPTPPKSRCYLGGGTSLALKERIGLPVLNEALVANNTNLPYLIKVLKIEGLLLKISQDCLWLLSQILNQQGNTVAVQQIVDSGLLPQIVNQHLNERNAVHLKLSSSIIDLIVKNGTIAVTETLVELGLVQKFVHLLSKQQGVFASYSISVLTRIANKSTSLRDIVLNADLVVPLTTLSEKKSVEIPRAVAILICKLCRGKPSPDFASGK